MTILQAIILGIVEGLSEFLPISSTGHMIITSALLGLNTDDPFVKVFEVVIQFGAILSILVIYWKRFLVNVDFYVKLLIAFIPAAVFGLLFNKLIDKFLGYPLIVGISLFLGGIILLFVDKLFKKNEEEPDNTITNRKAITIGLFQVISMIPGVSRSAATIVGGLTQKLNRKSAAEFSFFLAVPTMFAATCFKLLKSYKDLQEQHIAKLAVGSLVAFVVAMLAVQAMIFIVTKYGFKLFGWYRIIVGGAIIVAIMMGYSLKMVG